MSAVTSVTVYREGPGAFSVPGAIADTALGTVLIAYRMAGDPRDRREWFHALDAGGGRGGRRMGDMDDNPVRYDQGTTAMAEAA